MRRHEPLVFYAGQSPEAGGLPIEEAGQAGRIGLWQAILGFDIQRGCQFSNYAYEAIVHQAWEANPYSSPV